MKGQLVIPAAGRGTRLGSDGPKAILPLGGIPMLVRTLRAFESAGFGAFPVIVVSADVESAIAEVIAKYLPACSPVFVEGGKERQDSVRNGLAALHEDTEVVFIHDAARPFIQCETIRAVYDATVTHGAATVAIPAVDTVLEADGEAFLEHTPDRSRLWQCQTPQVFRTGVIREAHDWAVRSSVLGTDDATVVRRFGHPVKLVAGTRFNFKVTTPEDVALAELLIREGLV